MGDARRVVQRSTGARGRFDRPPREALSYGASGLLRNEGRSAVPVERLRRWRCGAAPRPTIVSGISIRALLPGRVDGRTFCGVSRRLPAACGILKPPRRWLLASAGFVSGDPGCTRSAGPVFRRICSWTRTSHVRPVRRTGSLIGPRGVEDRLWPTERHVL